MKYEIWNMNFDINHQGINNPYVHLIDFLI
jgi:hypothetical protein